VTDSPHQGVGGHRPRAKLRAFLLAGLLLSLLLAGVVSNFASSQPDGLERVSQDGCTVENEEIVGGECIAQAEREHEVGGPLADYGISGIDNSFLSTGLAGVLGVLLTAAVAGGLFWLVRRRDGSPERSGVTGARS